MAEFVVSLVVELEKLSEKEKEGEREVEEEEEGRGTSLNNCQAPPLFSNMK